MSKAKKKAKSAGFIESTSFKPTWLETGPLSPEMIPPELLAKVVEETAGGGGPSDDLLAQLAELERLYSEAESEDELPVAPAMVEIAVEQEAAESNELTHDKTADSEVVVVLEPDHQLAEIDEISDTASLDDVELPSEAAEFDESAITELPAETDEPTLDLTDAEATDMTTEIEAAEPVMETAPVAPPAARKPKAPPTPKRKHPFFDGPARTLLLSGLILLGLAALTYFVNPFARLALSTAELARPVTSPTLAHPSKAETNWCVTGGFLADGEKPLPMQDNGAGGDIVAEDQVFALQLNTIAPGSYPWQVVGCELGELIYPEAASWIQVDNVGQPVTFQFDSEERDDALFFPIPFAVSAMDSAQQFQVMGSFQDWNPNDPTATLQHLGGGVYQQVRRIARPGTYEAYVISGSPEQAIDAYGRTSEPIPFSFETSRRSDAVVFLLDTNRGRASVLYGMPWIATQLAYGLGFRILSLVLGLGGLLLLAWMLLRMIMMGNEENWLEAGCPECGHHELMRISRHPWDRFLNTLRIPAYRYQCRQCTWTGTRLSEGGAAVSPGATTIVAETLR